MPAIPKLQPQEQPPADPQAKLPPYLRYRPDEELVKLQLAFAQLLQQAERKATTASNLHAKQVQTDHNLPLFAHLAAVIQHSTADVISYVQSAMLLQEQLNEDEGPLVGIPVEDVSAMLQVLQDAMEALPKGSVGLRERLKDVMSTLEGYALEDEEEEEDDFILDDEEEEVPQPEPKPLQEPAPELNIEEDEKEEAHV